MSVGACTLLFPFVLVLKAPLAGTSCLFVVTSAGGDGDNPVLGDGFCDLKCVALAVRERTTIGFNGSGEVFFNNLLSSRLVFENPNLAASGGLLARVNTRSLNRLLS